jgi:hypothetical protein
MASCKYSGARRHRPASLGVNMAHVVTAGAATSPRSTIHRLSANHAKSWTFDCR